MPEPADVNIRTAEALEEAARKLRSADISPGNEDVQDILNDIQSRVGAFREEINARYHDIGDEYHRQVEPIEHIICEHPIPAVLAAVGFGFLIGLLISRTRD